MGLFRRESRAVEVVEQRDPTAATRSVRYTTKGMPQPPDWDASTAFRLANNTVLTCVDFVGKFLVKCPFHVGADPAKLDDYDIRHPLSRLLSPPPGGPNIETTSRELLKWTVGQRMMSGRFGWELELDSQDRPIAMWGLPTAHLVPVPSTSGNRYFERFEFGRPLDRRMIPREKILYSWIPSAEDWRQPDPPLRAAHLDLLVAVMQSRYDYAFYRNNARPDLLLITEQFADEDDKRAFEEQWNSTYGGPDNAGRIAVLEAEGGDPANAIHVESVGFTPKDAEAGKRYEFRLKQIASALGVPWSILDASARTFDNASQEWLNFVGGTLEPLACDLADAINMQLAPRFGSNVGWFDLRPLGVDKRTDPVTASVGVPSLVQAQIMTINEGRADYGLPPVPDGDRFMTADEIAALRGGTQPEAPTRNAVPEVREVLPDAAPLGIEPPSQSPEDRGETAEEAEARRTKIWSANDATVRNLERQWEKRVARLFARQLKSVLARLEHKRARRAASEIRALVDEVFDPEFWAVETADELRILYEQVAAASGEKMADRFGVAFDLDAPFVQEFIDERANQLAGGVTDTTYQAIKDALAAGIAEGEAVPELADRVQHVFDVASDSRATTIARTEVIGAYNGAGHKVASAYGPDVVAGKEWIATRDSRTRDLHGGGELGRDGEIVDIDEPFSGGLDYPGDPSGSAADVINCRCTVAFLTPEEMQRSAPRDVPLPVARAVLALVRPGSFDERAVRAVLHSAA